MSGKDVDQLGDLVEARAPQQPAKPSRSVSIGQKRARGVAWIAHRPELVQGERPLAKMAPLLATRHGRPPRE
jgi:hypothetical protein